MLKLHYVKGKNILSIGEQEVHFQLDDIHSTLIKGENGAGKTTVLEMICYSLFGRTLRDVKLTQLINSINLKRMLVTIEFSINGSRYKIERGQKPAKFIIYKDGVQLEELGSARQQQTYIEKVIGCGYHTFIQSTVIASTGYQNFMEISASQRREMIEKMLDLEIIGHMAGQLKSEKKTTDKWISTINTEHSTTRMQIQHQRDTIESLKDNSADLLQDLDTFIGRCEKRFNDDKKEYDEHIKCKPEIDVDSLKKTYEEFKTEYDEAQTQIRLNEMAVSHLMSEQNVANQTRSYYSDNRTCSVCKQDIDEVFADSQCSDADKKIEESGTRIQKLQKDNSALFILTSKLQEDMNEIIKSTDELTEWNQRLSMLKTEGQRHLKEKQQYEEQKLALQNKGVECTQKHYDEIERLEKVLSQVADQRAEATEAMEVIKIGEQILKDNGLKAKIVKKYLPIINELINKYLELMGAHYSFTLDETFNETILSRYRDNFTYKSFSNGERQRINLSIVFAWRHLASLKNTVSSSFLFIDEILDGSLDKEGIDGVMAIFDSMKDSNLYVISHRQDIIELFDRVYTAKKVGNFSTYEES